MEASLLVAVPEICSALQAQRQISTAAVFARLLHPPPAAQAGESDENRRFAVTSGKQMTPPKEKTASRLFFLLCMCDGKAQLEFVSAEYLQAT